MDVLWLAIRPAGIPSSAELERLACWAGGFTPRISLTAEALLLEVGGCLRLFGGLAALRARVADGLLEQDIDARLAVAATPQAALWLAGAGGGEDLDALPIAALDWPAGVPERLFRFGLTRLGELRRLPTAPLARRIGRPAALMLARAYGEVPDPRPEFAFPERFEQGIELPVPAERVAPVLLIAASRLIAALAGWLVARLAGVRSCRLDLLHRQGASPVVLRFATATHDRNRLERILRERLERLALSAPVESVRLLADEVEPLSACSSTLFAGGTVHEEMALLVERLRARLGEERIFGIAPVAAHRPECATRAGESGESGSLVSPPRPFWLLAEPEAMHEVAGRPYRRGPLRLLAGPERIESGWWDQGEGIGDCRRDYFIAVTADSRRAWIFRELKAPGGWFLHGWFG